MEKHVTNKVDSLAVSLGSLAGRVEAHGEMLGSMESRIRQLEGKDPDELVPVTSPGTT